MRYTYGSASARPALEPLFDRTHGTIDIAMGHGPDVAFPARILSDQEVRVVPITDRPHAMANGKAILSGLSDAQVTTLIGPKPLRLTVATKIDLGALPAERDDIHRTGFAYDREEHARMLCRSQCRCSRSRREWRNFNGRCGDAARRSRRSCRRGIRFELD